MSGNAIPGRGYSGRLPREVTVHVAGLQWSDAVPVFGETCGAAGGK